MLTPHSASVSDPAPVVRAFLRCFNEGRYYEAHEVLERLWLPVRRTKEGDLWKGLIQLAAAFVHVQKNRPGPARSLLQSARRRLRPFLPSHKLVQVPGAIELTLEWEIRILEGEGLELPSLLMELCPWLGPPRLAGVGSANADRKGRPGSE